MNANIIIQEKKKHKMYSTIKWKKGNKAKGDWYSTIQNNNNDGFC